MTGFPGGVGLTRLRVYPWAATDGLPGGSPHLHTASTEAYVVTSGHGRVLTLSQHGSRQESLEPGDVLWFSPGTVHRLINDSGDLEILAVMSNAGLPEHGDAVLTFPEPDLADPDTYRRLAALPDGDVAAREDAVRRRRDRAIEGFAELVDGGHEAFARFLKQAAALVGDRLPEWRELVTQGPVAGGSETLDQLDVLAAGDPGAMTNPVLQRRRPQTALGMCGHLETWDLRPTPDPPPVNP